MGAYSRRVLICKNEFLGGGLIEGEAYLEVGAYLRIYSIALDIVKFQALKTLTNS